MSIVGWLGLGVLVGFVASRLYECASDDFILDIVLGILGAIVGGWLFSFFFGGGNGVNLYSFLVAIIGAVIVLLIYHGIVGRRTL